MGKNTGLPPSVTLAALLSVLDPDARLFVAHRLGPHECEAVAEGTAEELRATRCVEVCGENVVVGLSLELDDPNDATIPILLVTIGEKEVQT